VANLGRKVVARRRQVEGARAMTFRHRYWHLVLWLAIAPTIAIGLVTAIATRPTPRNESAIDALRSNHTAYPNMMPAAELKP
jgi:hypothetical protein